MSNIKTKSLSVLKTVNEQKAVDNLKIKIDSIAVNSTSKTITDNFIRSRLISRLTDRMTNLKNNAGLSTELYAMINTSITALNDKINSTPDDFIGEMTSCVNEICSALDDTESQLYENKYNINKLTGTFTGR